MTLRSAPSNEPLTSFLIDVLNSQVTLYTSAEAARRIASDYPPFVVADVTPSPPITPRHPSHASAQPSRLLLSGILSLTYATRPNPASGRGGIDVG